MSGIKGLSDLAAVHTACRHAFGDWVWYSKSLSKGEKIAGRSTRRPSQMLLLIMLISRVYTVKYRMIKRIYK
jgi:hypothetical protein